jgi:hypothetical protein
MPDGDFCERGGRFGPHQFADTKNGEIIKIYFIISQNGIIPSLDCIKKDEERLGNDKTGVVIASLVCQKIKDGYE